MFDLHKSMQHTRTKYPEIPWARITSQFGCDLVISKATAMRSAAGWYAGRFCTELDKQGKPTCLEPYSRESGYYPSKALVVESEL